MNDVAVRQVCKTLDPRGERLVATEVRGRYVSALLFGVRFRSHVPKVY